MKNILIVFASVLAIASFTGCKKKGDSGGAALAKMTEFKEKMCKCAEGDADCAKKVSDEMTKWSEAQPKPKEGATAKPDPKAEEVGKQMGECMQKAMMPKMGSADPGSAAPDPGSAAPDPGSAAAGSGDGSAAPGSAEEKKEEKK